MMSRRAVLFVNGELPDPQAARSVFQPGDFVVAVDGGLRHARALGLWPEVLIGDLDSLAAEEVQAAEAAGVRVVRHPPEKDDTDLELGLELALEQGATTVRLVGALGGRVDHLLGNLFLLTQPRLRGIDARVDDGRQEIFIIEHEVVVEGRPGDLVSLLPITGPAVGVTTQRLRYPLIGETLYPYRTRGISNVMLDERAVVSLSEGVLCCVHIRGNAQLLEEL